MHPEMHQLYALHEIDARILTLDRTLRKLDNGEHSKAALVAARQDLARAEDTLKHHRVTLANADSGLKAKEAKQAQLNKRLYGGSVVNTREAEAVEHEIAMLKAAAGDIETEMLETMDLIESGEKSVAAYKQSVAAREAELASVLASYAKDSAAVQAQIADTQAQRPGAASPLSVVVMARYDSARKRTKETGVAALDGHMCDGCHMQVPGVAILKLRNTTDMVNCDNCARILYFKG